MGAKDANNSWLTVVTLSNCKRMNVVRIIYYRMESAVILSQIGLLHWAMLDVVDDTYVENVSFEVVKNL